MKNIKLLFSMAAFFLLSAICFNAVAQEVSVFPQMGYTGSVESLAFSPDGRYVISGSSDETIKLWDVNTGREIRTFSGHTSVVTSVTFSPDGNQILSGSWDQTIKLWDVNTGNVIRTFSGHTSIVFSVAFSPEGKQIISSSWDGTIKLWDVNSGKEIRTFSGHADSVVSVTFSPDGSQILSGSLDGIIKLWTNTGREIKTFLGHTRRVSSVFFSPDGKQIISSSWDGTIKLWDVNSGKVIRTFSEFNPVLSLALSPNGKQILSGAWIVDSPFGTIKLWDVNTGKVITTFNNKTCINSLSFSPDGKQIICGSGNGKIKLLDVHSELELMDFSGNTADVSSIAVSPDGSQFLLGNFTTKLWDASTGKEQRTFLSHTSWGYVKSTIFSPNGRQILFSSGNETIELWDTTTGKELRTFSIPSHVYSLAFSPDGEKFLSTFEIQHIVGYSGDNNYILGSSYTVDIEGFIKLWDTHTGKEIRTFSGHTSRVNSVAFSPDGKQILSGSLDGTIKLWDVNTGKEIRTFSWHTGLVTSVAFSPDGKQVLSGSIDKTIVLWDTASGKEIRTFSGHTDQVQSVAFCPDGKQFLSGSNDKTIKLWDTNTGRELRTFSGHTSRINSIKPCPNNKNFFSCSVDGTVRLWDISTGREIAQFISFNDGEWLVITPDGYYNSSPNGDKYINVRVGNTVYGIDQYRSTFYRPQIVEARLQGRPDPVRVVNDIQNANSFKPPMVVINSPKNGAVLSSSQVELSVTVVDQNQPSQPIKTVKVHVNGKLISSEAMKGISGVKGGDLEPTGIRFNENTNRAEFKFNLTLEPGKNLIEVFATNPYSEGRDSVEVTYRQSAVMQNVKPNLWILSIGVNRYDDTQHLPALKYAVNDAKAIIDFFKAQEWKSYAKVNTRLIADGTSIPPTVTNIQDGFSFLRQAQSNDVVMLFMSGHGVNDQYGNFYFMPSDAAFENGTIKDSKVISFGQIQSVLARPGRKIVFIDSCHSAGTSSGLIQRVNNDRLINSFKDNSSIKDSAVIFTSSRGDQTSWESDQYNHGAFTYAILQGLKGEADLMKKGVITATALELYIKDKIPALTDGQQTPYVSRPEGLDEFEIAVLK